MHVDEACKLLALDASTPEVWRQELLSLLRTQIEAKINDAPNPPLKGRYSAALATLEEATELIKRAAESGNLPSPREHDNAEGGQPKKPKFWETLADPGEAIELIARAAEGEDISSLTREAAAEKNLASLDPLAHAEDAIELIELVEPAAGEGDELPIVNEEATEGADTTAEEEEEGADEEDADEEGEDEEADEELEEEEEEEEETIVYTIEKKTKLDSLRQFFSKINSKFTSAKHSVEGASDETTNWLMRIAGRIMGNKYVRTTLLTIILIALMSLAWFGWQMRDSANEQKAIELVDFAQDLEEVKALHKAADFYQQALDAKSGWQDAVDGLHRVKLVLGRELNKQLSLAELEENNQDWRKALGHLKKADRLNPENEKIQDAIIRMNGLIAALRATFVVDTNPEGATISIGRNGQKISPATYENLPLEKHTVTISKKGYHSIKQEALLKKGMNTLGPLALLRIKGALNINSDLEGANYVISQVTSESSSDRSFQARTGQIPALEADLPTGDYLIKIAKLGWMDEQLNVSVSAVKQEEVLIQFTTLDEKLDLNNPKTRGKILGVAVDIDQLQPRSEEGEDTVYDLKGRLYTGWVKQMHDNGQTRALFSAKEGKKQGLLLWWHNNGMQWSKMHYKEGIKHGLFTFWEKNGQKLSETNYVDGNQHGLCSLWDENGQQLSITHYNDGAKHGLETLWRQSGQKQSEINYANGKKQDLATEWYKNGQKSKETNFENDELHGPSSAWDQHGLKRYKINYKLGKRHGLSTEWHPNGKKAFESNWQDGDPHGLSTSWDMAGKKGSETVYKNGQAVR